MIIIYVLLLPPPLPSSTASRFKHLLHGQEGQRGTAASALRINEHRHGQSSGRCWHCSSLSHQQARTSCARRMQCIQCTKQQVPPHVGTREPCARTGCWQFHAKLSRNQTERLDNRRHVSERIHLEGCALSPFTAYMQQCHLSAA